MQDNERRPDIEFGPVSNDHRCGLNAARRNVAQRRIVGGDEAGFGSFPWQAYIRIGEAAEELRGLFFGAVNKFQVQDTLAD